MKQLMSNKPPAWKLAAALATGLLLAGCAKHGGNSAVDKAMDQSGVYGGRNSGPNAANTGGADGAGGAPMGPSAPNSTGSGNTSEGNRAGPM